MTYLDHLETEIVNQIEFVLCSIDENLLIRSPLRTELIVTLEMGLLGVTGNLRSNLKVLSESVLYHQGIGIEDSGYAYGDKQRYPGEREFEGVYIYMMHDEVYVDTDAFDRMMLRFFREATRVANETIDKVLTEPWWPEFLQNVEIISERCNAE